MPAKCEAVYPWIGQCRNEGRVEIVSRDFPDGKIEMRFLFCWECTRSAIESGMFQEIKRDG